MKMHEEKMSLEEMKKAADQQLMELGMLDTVNNFLGTQETKDAIEPIYISWLEDLKVYAGKMPEVAHAVAGEILKSIENGKDNFVENVSLQFKRTLIGAMKHLMCFMPLEIVKRTLKSEQEWRKTLSKLASDMTNGINMDVKADIAEAAFTTFTLEEQVDLLVDVLEAEPNGGELIVMVDNRLNIRDMQYEVLEAFARLAMIFGFAE